LFVFLGETNDHRFDHGQVDDNRNCCPPGLSFFIAGGNYLEFRPAWCISPFKLTYLLVYNPNVSNFSSDRCYMTYFTKGMFYSDDTTLL